MPSPQSARFLSELGPLLAPLQGRDVILDPREPQVRVGVDLGGDVRSAVYVRPRGDGYVEVRDQWIDDRDLRTALRWYAPAGVLDLTIEASRALQSYDIGGNLTLLPTGRAPEWRATLRDYEDYRGASGGRSAVKRAFENGGMLRFRYPAGDGEFYDGVAMIEGIEARAEYGSRLEFTTYLRGAGPLSILSAAEAAAGISGSTLDVLAVEPIGNGTLVAPVGAGRVRPARDPDDAIGKATRPARPEDRFSVLLF